MKMMADMEEIRDRRREEESRREREDREEQRRRDREKEETERGRERTAKEERQGEGRQGDTAVARAVRGCKSED